MKKEYKLLLFDLDGTLFNYEKAEEYALRNSMEFFKINLAPGLFLKEYRKINKEMWRKYEKSEVSLDKLRVERFEELFNKFKIKQDIETFSRSYLNFISKASFTIKGAEELLSSLFGRYKIALITNGIYSIQVTRVKNSPIKKYFNFLVSSEKAGIAKPDPLFFDYTFKITKHNEKETAIIIGDSLLSDVKGGIDFEIDSCWFNPYRIKNEEKIKPIYEITKLSEVKEILQR
jgi:2-haloacid dehalogenase